MIYFLIGACVLLIFIKTSFMLIKYVFKVAKFKKRYAMFAVLGLWIATALTIVLAR